MGQKTLDTILRTTLSENVGFEIFFFEIDKYFFKIYKFAVKFYFLKSIL